MTSRLNDSKRLDRRLKKENRKINFDHFDIMGGELIFLQCAFKPSP